MREKTEVRFAPPDSFDNQPLQKPFHSSSTAIAPNYAMMLLTRWLKKFTSVQPHSSNRIPNLHEPKLVLNTVGGADPKAEPTVCLPRMAPKLIEGEANAVIDREAIARIRQYDDDGSDHTLAEIVALFLELTPKRIEHLKRSLKESDWKSLGREAHSMKSSSANLGARRLHQACRKLEAIENHPDLIGATELVQEIETEFRQASNELTCFLKTSMKNDRKASA